MCNYAGCRSKQSLGGLAKHELGCKLWAAVPLLGSRTRSPQEDCRFETGGSGSPRAMLFEDIEDARINACVWTFLSLLYSTECETSFYFGRYKKQPSSIHLSCQNTEYKFSATLDVVAVLGRTHALQNRKWGVLCSTAPQLWRFEFRSLGLVYFPEHGGAEALECTIIWMHWTWTARGCT